MREIWKDVPGYKGFYQASNLGRIRSLDRISKRNGRPFKKSGQVLNRHVGSGGYLKCILYRTGKPRRSIAVHQVIALSFKGRRQKGKEVCHNDGVKTNCAASNLRYDFPISNSADRWKHGTFRHGERGPAAKLTEHDVLYIRRRYAEGGITQKRLAELYGVVSTTICQAISGVNWPYLR